MNGNRKRDTRPEVALRAALHRSGLRFRKVFQIRPDDGRLIRPDVVFTRQRVAVFLDGSFWHACPEHGTRPRSNTGYWAPKLARNVERDREIDKRLLATGWTGVRVWEHEPVIDAVDKVQSALRGS